MLNRCVPGTLILPDVRIYDDGAFICVADGQKAMFTLDALQGGSTQWIWPSDSAWRRVFGGAVSVVSAEC